MPVVHIVSSFLNYYGGSEREALGLFTELDPLCDVSLWSVDEPDAPIVGQYPIRRIVRGSPNFPLKGTIIFVGVFFEIAGWIQAFQGRIIVMVNTAQPFRLREIVAGLARAGHPKVDVVYVCDGLRKLTPEIPGVIHSSPIDLEAFSPNTGEPGEFVVGRHSRDLTMKFHPDDPALLLRLAEAGVRVRIMGGTCLAPYVSHERIELLPMGAEPAPDFLRSLSAFIYRTDPGWYEAFGRVVAEAMACGLPAIVERNSGPTEYITDRVSGLLGGDSEDYFEKVMRLRDDAVLRASMGLAARGEIEAICSPIARRKMLDYYLNSINSST
jgi:glycosyltransferase involved in cell wall biosynthesis